MSHRNYPHSSYYDVFILLCIVWECAMYYTYITQPPAGAVPSAQCVVDVLDEHDSAITAIAGDEEKLVSGSSDLSVKVIEKI